MNHPSIKQIVEFGLDQVPNERKVEIPLQDLLYVYQALGELNRFFHQPLHYPTLDAVESFLGDRNSGGGYEVIHTALYAKLREMIPPDIEEMFGDGKFDHPDPPAYYGPSA